MKKLLAILLSAILVLALSACVNNSGGSANNGADTNGGNIGASQPSDNASKTPSDANSDTGSSAPADKLTRDQAIAKALEKAGVKKEDVRDLSAELDRDRDGLFWEVEFEIGKTEYDYDINAETGEIFEVGKRPVEAEQKITRDDAVSKALSAAGLKKADVRELEAELDKEHGGVFWEVEFEAGNTEYSYDINASTGEIVKAERERD